MEFSDFRAEKLTEQLHDFVGLGERRPGYSGGALQREDLLLDA